MNFKMAVERARRAFRDDLKLYLVAVSSLTVAFLCLAVALLGIGNLSAVAEHWGQGRRLTVYVADDASPSDVQQLAVILGGLSEVSDVEHVTSEEARAQFLAQADLGESFEDLEAEVFPASLEVSLRRGTSSQQADTVGQRIAHLSAAEQVETYGGWFGQLDALVGAGKGLAAGLAFLVIICVLAVVGNTIRLSVAGRRDEIEVMKLCGATDAFVRRPFLVEGVFQGTLAAALSVLLLYVGFQLIRGQIDASIGSLAGVPTVFLAPEMVAGIVVAGAIAGAAGSALSLRRYLMV
ncbi:MAG: permease-like cell division protein FtsX [Myxococcota bacterium]